jgi:hypothetical protein
VDIVGGSFGVPDQLIGIVSDAIFVTALAAVGLKVLLTSDAEWEAGPETVRIAQPSVAA